ncbi:MAG TPA: phosphoglucomutase/phosphomannomutase family protein [Candidatus Eisenbacteria bacterium]|nr:phosphoglucomutase/phosphomannomutase family protein [Candidatus Eisenbacteria bacterium]
MSVIKFGTDGWRALMDADFTTENVEKVAQAFADFLNAGAAGKKAPRVVIGYDWRKNSENFAKSVADVLAGNGIEPLLSTQASPTPAVSYAVVDGKFDAGVIITASHNPPGYNGFKIKNDFGGSAEKRITDGVEALIGRNPVRRASGAKTADLNLKYLEYLKKYVRLDAIKDAPFRVLVDSMHGIGGRNIERVLAGGKIRVTTIRGERDVTFGGRAPEPIPANFTKAAEMMKTGEYDLGIVTDGDADRVGAIRPGGEFISPGIILSLIMAHFVQDLGRKGSVVTTISNTRLIYKMATKLGLKVHETPVGFKYVCDIMRKENVLIGGEESGGIGFQDYLYERDGVLSGLLLIEMMAMRGKNVDAILKDVEKEFGKLFYVRRDLEYPNELKARLFQTLAQQPPKTLAGHAVKEVNGQDGMKFILDDDSWLLFRLSGTEPILRVYSEATSEALAESLVAQGKELAFNLPAPAAS